MPVQLNHMIIPSVDKKEAASFLAEILGLPEPKEFGPFMCLETANGVGLDYDTRDPIVPTHYAFHVTEDEFDEIYQRVLDRGITYWADPMHQHEGKLNKNGRGFYFLDPSGHNMEVLTRAFG
jgi:extradiol dioxygenase family protein